MRRTLMSIPNEMVDVVSKVIKDHTNKKPVKGLPKPIKRKLRITKKQIADGGKIIKEHIRYGMARDRYTDKIDNELDRLDVLLDGNRSKADKKWLEEQMDKLDTIRDYAYNA